MYHLRPDNDQKAQVWQAYHERRPTRVPVRLSTNPRIILLDPSLNTRGLTFAQAQTDPRTHVEVCLQWQLHLRTCLNRFTDSPTGLPEVWDVWLHVYNVYEAAALGAEVQFSHDQLPATEPILDDSSKRSIFKVDIEHPLETPFIRQCLSFWHEMKKVCQGMTFEGRPVQLQPFALTGTDGPVTVACNLRGDAFLMELVDDPQYADQLMTFVTDAAIHRRRAFEDYWGQAIGRGNGMADDSCAMLSPDMYRSRVLPMHRRYYAAADRALTRGMHLCGNASHLFPIIHDELGVTTFDTGFPIDHGKIRRELGEDVEISGGPQVALLLQGSENEVYERTRAILHSGVKQGGRYILQEGNNLPPCVPQANLAAMYQACLDHGRYA